MEIINKLKSIAVFIGIFLFIRVTLIGSNSSTIPIKESSIRSFTLPTSFVILDTLMQSQGGSDSWIIQLKPDPFFDGIRIKPTVKQVSFSWCLKTTDGFELARRIVRHREAKLDLTYLSTGTYVLELSLESGSDVSSLLLAKY